MFDIKLIRDDQKAVEAGLAAKNVSADLSAVLKADKKRKDLLLELEELRSQKNAASRPQSQPVRIGLLPA